MNNQPYWIGINGLHNGPTWFRGSEERWAPRHQHLGYSLGPTPPAPKEIHNWPLLVRLRLGSTSAQLCFETGCGPELKTAYFPLRRPWVPQWDLSRGWPCSTPLSYLSMRSSFSLRRCSLLFKMLIHWAGSKVGSKGAKVAGWWQRVPFWSWKDKQSTGASTPEHTPPGLYSGSNLAQPDKASVYEVILALMHDWKEPARNISAQKGSSF